MLYAMSPSKMWVATTRVAVEVDDKPGGLKRVLDLFDRHDLHIEYMYAFTFRREDKAVMIFRFDDPHRALQALRMKGIRTIPGAELYSM